MASATVLTFRTDLAYLQYLVLRACAKDIIERTADNYCEDCRETRDQLTEVLDMPVAAKDDDGLASKP